MAAKFVYTETEVAQIVAKYERGDSLDQLADEYNKSVQSIRMKLVKLGVYKAKSGAIAKSSTSTVEEKPKLTKKQEAAANLELFKDLEFEYGAAPF